MNEQLESTLIVGRDRAHVRSLLLEYPSAQVISASAFFDHIRLLPFLYDPLLRRDDSAPLAFAYDLLGQQEVFSRRMAKRFVTLYSSLFHGTMRPLEVHSFASGKDFEPVLSIIAAMERAMEANHLVNAPSALFKAWQLMRDKELIPPALKKIRHLSLRYLIDLTALEIEVVKTLASVGLSVEVVFPLDFMKRAINVAVDFAARQFELACDEAHLQLQFKNLASEGPLKALVEALLQDDAELSLLEEHCTIELMPSIDEEANHCAQTIAALKAAEPSAQIALALRSFDQRSESYKRALLAMGLEVRDRKGQALSDAPAGLLLKTIFSARHSGLARKDLVALSMHPLMALPQQQNLFALLDILGIDDALLLKAEPECRYGEPLGRWQAMLSDEQKPEVEGFKNLLEHLKELLALIPQRASWHAFLQGQLLLIKRALSQEDRSVSALHDLVASLLVNAHHAGTHEIELHELEHMLWAELSSATVLPKDYSDQKAVELVLLPELVGRSFDHVVIPDISFGRLPKSLEGDPLLSDAERLALNKAVGRPLLRVYLDDPFEPIGVPSRQTLEPFWFAAALACAKKSVHLSCASLDESNGVQAPSEFFAWLMDHVHIERSSAPKPLFISQERARFEAGLMLKTEGGVSSEQRQAFIERLHAFTNNKAGAFAFQMKPEDLLLSFGGRLDKEPSRPLTPTMIEAFSQCRFHGWLNRIIDLAHPEQGAGDLDPRVVGGLAHQALERFFASYDRRSSPAEHLNHVRQAVEEEYVAQNFVPNLELFFCYSEWLFASLLVIIERLLAEGFLKPIAVELPFGLAHGREGLLIASLENRYILGGVIDRLDHRGSEVVVMDYKLARADRLRELSSPRALFKSNFQIPIYLRLARAHFVRKEQAGISFIYASIRDGVLVDAWSETKNADQKEAIFNDEHEDGLAAAIDRIFAPIKAGQVLATVSEQCTQCDFAFVCRKAERGRDV